MTKPTQSKRAAEKEAEDEQHEGDEELAVLSDGGDKGRASCRLPDLVQ